MEGLKNSNPSFYTALKLEAWNCCLPTNVKNSRQKKQTIEIEVLPGLCSRSQLSHLMMHGHLPLAPALRLHLA